MKRRYLTSSLLTCFVLSFLVMGAAAQNLRPDDTFFLKPRVGLSDYTGDWDQDFFAFNDFDVDGKFPYSVGLEIGYAFSPMFNIALAGQVADYPTILPREGDTDIYFNPATGGGAGDNPYTRRYTGQLLLRFQGPWRIAPFLTLGGQASYGYSDANTEEAEENYTGFGPVVGLGLDFVLTNRMSLVLEALTNFVLDDYAMDGGNSGQEPNEPVTHSSLQDELDDSSMDLLSSLTLGLKYNFASAFTPIDVMTLDCPSQLMVGESATFSAIVNDDEATPPVSYSWDFGNGAEAGGLLATYSYPSAGTYTVTFDAMNEGNIDSEICVVEVVQAPEAAIIEDIDANPSYFEVCEPTVVQFSSDVSGDAPVEYNWDFGDGTDGEGANPSHVYDQPGTYTVTLSVENDYGSDVSSLTITAEPCAPGICAEITEMNPVFFDRNSSTLTADARDALMENVEIFEECPELCAELRGYASELEREPQALSEARAEAVLDFYVDNGLDDDRFEVIGMGSVGETTKKGGGAQFRRVDTIPMDCIDL